MSRLMDTRENNKKPKMDYQSTIDLVHLLGGPESSPQILKEMEEEDGVYFVGTKEAAEKYEDMGEDYTTGYYVKYHLSIGEGPEDAGLADGPDVHCACGDAIEKLLGVELCLDLDEYADDSYDHAKRYTFDTTPSKTGVTDYVAKKVAEILRHTAGKISEKELSSVIYDALEEYRESFKPVPKE